MSTFTNCKNKGPCTFENLCTIHDFKKRMGADLMLKPEICTGRGDCIKPCYCPCFDSLVYDDTECKCGHNGYCPGICCAPVECHNHRLCFNSVPQYVLDINDGICNKCVKQYGKLNYAELSMPCAVCTRRMEMIELSCGHMTCILCWRSNSYVECLQCTFSSNLDAATAYSTFMDTMAYFIILLSVTVALFILNFNEKR